MKAENKKPKTSKAPKEYKIEEQEPAKVEEPLIAYPQPVIDYDNKRYTYADYMSWFDDKRREIINGIARLMSGPNRRHATLSRKLFLPIGNYLEKRKGNCQTYCAPFDVRLPKKAGEIEDNKIDTVVQPDICVICDPLKLDDKGCIGAPEMVIEILSPTNHKYDFNDKYNKYEAAGVKEYWIVSPFTNGISIFILQPDGTYGRETFYQYPKDDIIPVKTLPGLKINLKNLFEE